MAVLPFGLRVHFLMNPLALPEEAYRQVYDRVTELALGYLLEINKRSSFPGISGAELQSLFASPIPEQGMGEAALDDLVKVIGASRAQGEVSRDRLSRPPAGTAHAGRARHPRQCAR